MKLKLILIFLLCFLLVVPVFSKANVYPDKDEINAIHFIKVTQEGNNFSFELCPVADDDKCINLGSKKWYSYEQISKRRNYYNDCMKVSGFFGFLILPLFATGNCFLNKQTIRNDVLFKNVTLTYIERKNEKGEIIETGSIYEFAERIEQALNI
ncbi:MAG: hypothetical protein ABIA04_14780 [Pseudomonadota bacterium]